MMDKTRILVVDDEDIVCKSVKKILAKEGFEVDTAMRADIALAKIGENKYGLVITDLMMPEMNGIELMHAIRKRDLAVPFLMITGYPTIRTAMQALRLGAVDYIPKPFTRQEILAPVGRALRRKLSLDEKAEEEAPAASVLPGDRFVLPEHSWAVYEQDGTVAVGIEKSFLDSAGQAVSIEAPAVNEMIEQGYPVFKVKTGTEEEHGVFAPFSGRVIAVNGKLKDPGAVTAGDWAVRIIPGALEAEAAMLVKK